MSERDTAKSTSRRLGGRPTADQAEAIDVAIFEAARRLFLNAGLKQTSMEAVAAEAKISRTTLYARHKSKDQLLRAVINAQVQAWGREQRIFRDPLPKDFKQRLHHHARAVIQMMMSEDVLAFQRLSRSMASGDAKYAQVMNEIGYRSAIETLAREITEGCRDRPTQPRYPEGVAEMLMALLAGWVAGRENGPSMTSEDAVAFADQAVDILFFGQDAW